MHGTPKLEGAMTALVTPFLSGGTSIDERALAELCEAQIRGGIDGLIPCGTTGEAPALSLVEHERVVRIAVEVANKRVPVIAGCGANTTAHALELASLCRRAGADALLVVTPYYNKPTQEGLYQHFAALAEVGLPVVLYNVPGRTGCDLLPETVARLCTLPRIAAIKEATGSVQRTQQIIEKVGDRLPVLSGEDAINYPLYCVGARGCISVVGNVAPGLTAEIWDATKAMDHGRARRLHYQFLPLAEALFFESNPIPVKTALSILTAQSSAPIQPLFRLPLCSMGGAAADRLRAVLAQGGWR